MVFQDYALFPHLTVGRNVAFGIHQLPKAAQAAYDSWRGEDGQLPATWEIITAMAWAPAHGQPIREGGEDVARFPASGIPVRRRGG